MLFTYVLLFGAVYQQYVRQGLASVGSHCFFSAVNAPRVLGLVLLGHSGVLVSSGGINVCGVLLCTQIY
jgi:hypothetical protein